MGSVRPRLPAVSRLVTCRPLDRDDNVQRELRDWGLSFDSNLLSFSGRVLQAEKIHQGGKTVGAGSGRRGLPRAFVGHPGPVSVCLPG